MFDKRLMQMCPESRRYIFGNIVLQWLELLMNAVMIGLIALSVEQLWQKNLAANAVLWRIIVILITIVVRWFATKGATRMSYLASRTVKRVMREQIYQKLLRPEIAARIRNGADDSSGVAPSVDHVYCG